MSGVKIIQTIFYNLGGYCIRFRELLLVFPLVLVSYSQHYIGVLLLFFFLLSLIGAAIIGYLLISIFFCNKKEFPLFSIFLLAFISIIIALIGGCRLIGLSASFPSPLSDIKWIKIECHEVKRLSSGEFLLVGEMKQVGFSHSAEGHGGGKGWVQCKVSARYPLDDYLGKQVKLEQLVFFQPDYVRLDFFPYQTRLFSFTATHTILLLKENRGHPLQLYFRKMIKRGRRKLRKWTSVHEEAGGLLLALLEGERADVQEAVRRSYQKAGVSHLLALSGMHLGLITSLVGLICCHLLGQKRAWIVSAIIAVLYGCFAFGSPSLFRAVVMMQVTLLFRLRGGEVPIKFVLALSFVISVIIQPETIYSPALILSYLALVGLLYFEPILYCLFAFIPINFLRRGISCVYAVQLITSGWIYLNFGGIASSSLISSIILTPITFLFMILGTLSLFLGVFIDYLLNSSLTHLIFIPAKGVYLLNEKLLLFFSSFPIIENSFTLFLYFMPLILLFIYRRVLQCRWKKWNIWFRRYNRIKEP